MAYDHKVVSISEQGSMHRFTLPVALIRLRDASGLSLKSVLASFFDRADDALFELADRAATNADQTAYFDAMRELRLRRKSMVVSVLQHVGEAFNGIGRHKSRPASASLAEVDQDSLSLVDHSQLEQQVAIDNLITKLHSQHADQIRLLTERVNHLIPKFELTDSQMPLGPETICEGVAEACADLDIDIRAKLVVLKLFDRLLAGTLGDFYRQANKTLIAEGVLPDMKRPGSGTQAPIPGKSAPEVASRASVAVPPGRALEPSTLSQQAASAGYHATFSELSALLHQSGATGASDGPSAGGMFATGGNAPAFLDTDRLMARLSTVQTASRQAQAAGGQVVTLTEQLKPVLQAENGAALQLAQVDNDVINLVAMLFDFILEDRQLDPVMKSLIGRLQIPVLKVALSDKNFFNRGGHPVRKLLNELALSAIGWSAKRNGQRDPLREKIESVIDRVTNDFTDNVELFEELLSDFGQFMDLDRRRRQLVEQRLRDAEEGRARQEQASQVASELIREQVAPRDIPGPVINLLQGAWDKYLQWVALREGETSDGWVRARELTARLVWSVDPSPVTESTRSELLRLLPTIVDGVRSALHEISWDPFAIDSAIRDLELAHVDVFQRLDTSPTQPSSLDVTMPGPALEPASEPEAKTDFEAFRADSDADAGAAGGDEVARQPLASHEALVSDQGAEPGQPAPAGSVGQAEVGQADNATVTVTQDLDLPATEEWLKRADGLGVGSWIELTQEDSKVRCKLAAFIKATGRFIFVNRSGAKVAEYHRQELAVAMAAGDVTMLDDGLIFDRALESIIDNLRSSRKD